MTFSISKVKLYIDKMEGSPNNEPSGSKGGKPQWSIDMIQAADAWDVQKGNTSILVAVIDSGSD